MRKIIIMLICSLTVTLVQAQIDIEVKEFSPILMPNLEMSHAVKISVKNGSEKPIMLFLLNDPHITGYSIKDCSFPNPLTLLGELTSTMYYSDDLLPLTFFANWYKIVKPDTTFVFYFQSSSSVDVDGLLKLIKHARYSPLPYIEKLDYKEDVIVIRLAPVGQ